MEIPLGGQQRNVRHPGWLRPTGHMPPLLDGGDFSISDIGDLASSHDSEAGGDHSTLAPEALITGARRFSSAAR
jgi:hypothetical protein